MRKIFFNFVFFSLLGIIFIPKLNDVYAVNECSNINIYAIDLNNNKTYSPFIENEIGQINYEITVNQSGTFYVYADNAGTPGNYWDYKSGSLTSSPLKGTITSWSQFRTGNHKLQVYIERGGKDKFGSGTCDGIGYTVNPAPTSPPRTGQCSINISPAPPTIIKSTTPVEISVTTPTNLISGQSLIVEGKGARQTYNLSTTVSGNTFTSSPRTWNDDVYTVVFSYQSSTCIRACPTQSCKTEFIVDDTRGGWVTPTVSPLPTPTDDPNICNSCSPSDCSSSAKPQCDQCSFCLPTLTPIQPLPSLAQLCDQLPTENNYSTTCWNCINTGGIWTAIGCLPTNLEVILKDYVFVYGTGITGGIAFLYFIYGVFLILTSGGNAEKIAEGKEIIISALSGLFLIIFSVFLLRVIGYDILKLPGFS